MRARYRDDRWDAATAIADDVPYPHVTRGWENGRSWRAVSHVVAPWLCMDANITSRTHQYGRPNNWDMAYDLLGLTLLLILEWLSLLGGAMDVLGRTDKELRQVQLPNFRADEPCFYACCGNFRLS